MDDSMRRSDDLAPLPDWLRKDIAQAARPKARTDQPLVELDTPEAVDRAVAWLTQEAPDAIQGDGGDLTTFKVAARLKEIGLSAPTALDLMLTHWNDRQSPPWDPEDLAVKVENGFAYSASAWGGQSAAADFDSVEIDRPAGSELRAGLVRPEDFDLLPPREWLYGRKFPRKYVSFVASPGGVGKTAWTIAVALACASGRRLLHDAPHHPMRVWLFNLEDDIHELRRRLLAAIRLFELPMSVLDNIRLNSGRDRGLKVMRMRDEQFVTLPDADLLREELLTHRIELLIVDPYLRSHGVPENSNEAQDAVIGLYTRIADATSAHISLVHHTKKGAVAGEQDSMRGGSAQGGSARTVLTLSPMSPDDAQAMGIDEGRRRAYVRIDDAKRNMAPAPDKAEWLKLVSFNLRNGTPEYPEGDDVQVTVKWTPPSAWDGVGEEGKDAVLDQIDQGPEEGERYGPRQQAGDRWAGHVVVDLLGKSPSEAATILKEWVRTGVLEVKSYHSASQRKTRQGVFVRRER